MANRTRSSSKNNRTDCIEPFAVQYCMTSKMRVTWSIMLTRAQSLGQLIRFAPTDPDNDDPHFHKKKIRYTSPHITPTATMIWKLLTASGMVRPLSEKKQPVA